jgi:Tfp pilus assembly protein PilF
MAEFGEPESAADSEPGRDAGIATDGAAVAVALGRARRKTRGGGDDAEQRFLAAQEALIADQRRHLAAQYKTMGLDDWHKRLRLLTQGLTVLAGVLVMGALAWTAWEAHEADGIVIKPFSVPPALAQRGVTGEAVASQVMDQLSTMAETSRSSEQQKSVDAAWGEHISIAIPETGVSLNQVDQWLRQKLGHERQVTGEVSVNPDGTLSVASREGGHVLPTQAGPEADLGKMTTKLAEAIYGREQPTSFYQYLANQGRWQEALDQARARFRAAKSPQERALGLNGVALALQNLQGDMAAKPYYERALALAPASRTRSTLERNLAGIEFELGHEEREYALDLASKAEQGMAGVGAQKAEAVRVNALTRDFDIAADLGDFAEELRTTLSLDRTNQEGILGDTDQSASLAGIRAALHEPGAAISSLQGYEPKSKAAEVFKEGALAAAYDAAQDWAQALTHRDRAEALVVDAFPDHGASAALLRHSSKAVELAKVGRVAEAQAMVATLPLDCDFCTITRGQVAEAAGDRRAADHWFGEAARMMPSLPFANEIWGRALLARGDATGALARFDAAHARSPRFPDAAEGRGEALLVEGDAASAATAFAEAGKLAPKWGKLHLKWGEALGKLGKPDEARAQFKAASGLDLTAAERAELAAQKV